MFSNEITPDSTSNIKPSSFLKAFIIFICLYLFFLNQAIANEYISTAPINFEISQTNKILRNKFYPPIKASFREPIRPIPSTIMLNEDMVELGLKLFVDKRFSFDNTISCATCHPLEKAGMDAIPVGVGVNGLKGNRNTPSVYNSSLNFRQFWDGKVRTLEEQIDGPLLNKHEFNSNWNEVIAKLKKDKQLIAEFNRLYPNEGISINTIKLSIATFERSLLTPNSPFDRYLKGEKSAISSKAKSGYKLFKHIGCTACHNGVNVGGNLYEKLGIIYPFYITSGHKAKYDEDEDIDFGRYNFTQNESDRFSFKVPSLRNVALTGPYLHDGSIDSLYSVVRIMSTFQLGRTLSDNEILDIVQFLETLTGKFPQFKIKYQESGSATVQVEYSNFSPSQSTKAKVIPNLDLKPGLKN